MSYQTPITIKKAIDNICSRHYVLPAIQREFVWEQDQIIKLFDSLMREYPISTFLFWKVEKEKSKDYQFYEFLRDYNELSNRHNQKIDYLRGESVIAVLDGQQRLTSLYIALAGSYAAKLPYKRKDSKNSYPKKKLYLNLLDRSEDPELLYDFRFLTEEEARNTTDAFWFEVGKTLNFSDPSDPMMYVNESGFLMDPSVCNQTQRSFAIKTLSFLFNMVHQKFLLVAYEEDADDLDKVLQIFIRTNSGGTKLDYSDLLLSIATAQWKGRDAREEIHALVDDLNRVGYGFSFSKDNVLKSCLVLVGLDVKFKSDNFNRSNMEKIESEWDSISNALLVSVRLLSKLGYNSSNLISSNMLVPIAHYIYKNELDEEFLHSGAHSEDRKSIKEWLARATLSGAFSSSTDSLYPGYREVINSNLGKFPLEEIIEKYKGTTRSLIFSLDDIETILDLKYGSPKAFAALSLVYPGLNHSFHYHVDHIHPQCSFKKKALQSMGLNKEEIEEFIQKQNLLPNLQLLQENTNTEKSGKPFHQWLDEHVQHEQRATYLIQNHIQPDQSLEFECFLEFVKSRRETIKVHLCAQLGLNS